MSANNHSVVLLGPHGLAFKIWKQIKRLIVKFQATSSQSKLEDDWATLLQFNMHNVRVMSSLMNLVNGQATSSQLILGDNQVTSLHLIFKDVLVILSQLNFEKHLGEIIANQTCNCLSDVIAIEP